jgi:Fe2+ transport system protein FeoA
MSLSDLREGESATVVGLGEVSAFGSDADGRDTLVARLRDLGFVQGARCEVIARMWLGDPLALRRVEAAAVRVEREVATHAARVPVSREGASAATA